VTWWPWSSGSASRGRMPVTGGGVVAQVWRGGGRQAPLARLLAGTDVVAVDDGLGRRAGMLLAVAWGGSAGILGGSERADQEERSFFLPL
jgi:hypothetical protein